MTLYTGSVNIAVGTKIQIKFANDEQFSQEELEELFEKMMNICDDMSAVTITDIQNLSDLSPKMIKALKAATLDTKTVSRETLICDFPKS